MPTPQLTAKRKILFRLEADDDGYPPVSVESLWVRPMESGNVVLDNIPFFAKGIAPGDELAIATNDEGDTWFQALVKPSGVSVFRIHAANNLELENIREDLLSRGIPSEVNGKLLLIAIEIPACADIRPVLDYLVNGQESNRFDFEEGVLRHRLPG